MKNKRNETLCLHIHVYRYCRHFPCLLMKERYVSRRALQYPDSFDSHCHYSLSKRGHSMIPVCKNPFPTSAFSLTFLIVCCKQSFTLQDYHWQTSFQSKICNKLKTWLSSVTINSENHEFHKSTKFTKGQSTVQRSQNCISNELRSDEYGWNPITIIGSIFH